MAKKPKPDPKPAAPRRVCGTTHLGPIDDGRLVVMSSDPFCLNCGEEITWDYAEWRWASTSDGSPTCTRGRNAGQAHTTELPGREDRR